MSFLRGTRKCLHNIKQNDVCRMFWLGSSPYIPKASSEGGGEGGGGGRGGSKISTFMKAKLPRSTSHLTYAHKRFCKKKMQGDSVKNTANYSTNKKINYLAAENLAQTVDKLRFNIICGTFGILGFATLGGEWRPGWEFDIKE